MKKIYLLFFFYFIFNSGFSQNCVSLGCAARSTGITTDGTLPDTGPNTGLGCYDGSTYKQVFWQFFYSPSGGDFTQTYTPTSNSNLAINFVAFDIGTTSPAGVNCPVNTSGWTSVVCAINDHFNQSVGPGVAGFNGDTLGTVSGHYYAIAIIIWQGTSNGADASYTFDISTPQLAGIDLTSANCPGVLPVKLSSFNAKVNNCIVNLDWIAENESNLKNYEIQSSIDGINFHTISSINGSTQGSTQKYSYRDIDPKNGNDYYRLKMNNIDGKFEFSGIIPVKVNCMQSSIRVFPNPVSKILNVYITSLQIETKASLFDNTGKLIYTGTVVSGQNTINMENFAKGIYLLKIKNNNVTQNLKIIK